jgi:hypothetical protein
MQIGSHNPKKKATLKIQKLFAFWFDAFVYNQRNLKKQDL